MRKALYYSSNIAPEAVQMNLDREKESLQNRTKDTNVHRVYTIDTHKLNLKSTTLY